LNGLPVALGEALAALGASADIVAAGRNFDAAGTGAADVNVPALPANLEALVGFQAALAERFANDVAFNGGAPEIIDAYLRFLAQGGQIAAFQETYAALVTSYLELLSTGGFPADFTGLGALDVQAYLDYLNAIGALGRLGDAQQGLIAEYLAFLRSGGVPSAFIASNVTLSSDVVALYQTAISDFITFVTAGGAPSQFDGLSQDLLTRYIQLLESSGVLETIFGAQAEILQAYADFLAGGGAADAFDGLDDLGLSDALAQQYTEVLQTLISTLVDGGNLADLNIPAASLVSFIDALERAGLLSDAFADQRDILLAFSQFVADGGAPDAFDGFGALGLSDAAAVQLEASVDALIAVFSAGGGFADFTGDLDAVLAAIERLQGAGRLSDLFGAALAAQLEAFTLFVENGGTPGAFDGFTAIPLDAAAQADLVATVTQFITALASGADFTDLLDEYQAFIAALTRLTDAGDLADLFGAQAGIFTQLFTFLASGGNPVDFDFTGLIGAGGGNMGGGDMGGGGATGGERSDQFVAYTSSIVGVDQRAPATVTYDDATGAPIGYVWDFIAPDRTEPEEQPSIGAAELKDGGSAGTVLGWGRWAGGRTSGRFYANTDGFDLPADGGWHLITGEPATNLPTSGTVEYDLIGWTAPTRRDGAVAPGTLDSARAVVAFGTQSRIGVDLNLTIGGEGYTVSTAGGADNPSQGLIIGEFNYLTEVGFRGDSFNGGASASGGSLCNGASAGCNATITGFLAGDGASHVGLAYT
ncbi:MAG: hypothetical protein WBG08_14620, partial [Litorimonas sp.]